MFKEFKKIGSFLKNYFALLLIDDNNMFLEKILKIGFFYE